MAFAVSFAEVGSVLDDANQQLEPAVFRDMGWRIRLGHTDGMRLVCALPQEALEPEGCLVELLRLSSNAVL